MRIKQISQFVCVLLVALLVDISAYLFMYKRVRAIRNKIGINKLRHAQQYGFVWRNLLCFAIFGVSIPYCALTSGVILSLILVVKLRLCASYLNCASPP